MQYQGCKPQKEVYNVAIMSSFEGIVTPHIISFQEQPLFPYEDLSRDNTEYLTQHFTVEPAATVMSKELFDAQLGLYQVALATQPIMGISCENSQTAYEAFTSGFATFRAIAKAVGSGTNVESWTLGARNAGEILLTPIQDAPAARMTMALKRWQMAQPNTTDVVFNLHSHMPPPGLHAASLGAAMAYKLSRN